MELVLKSASEETTLALGSSLGSAASPGDVICLIGELGTGKTVIVRGMARARGHSGPVTSPTFTIINEYVDAGLCHVDAYRLDTGEQLIGAGIDDYLDGEWVCAVEWADRVRPALPSNALSIEIAFGEAENERVITIREEGGWDGRLARIMKELMSE